MRRQCPFFGAENSCSHSAFPGLTRYGHWLCTAAMVPMPVSALIKVLVCADKMRAPALEGGHAAARFHYPSRRRGGHVAACRARAAATDASGRLPQQLVTTRADFCHARVPPGPQRGGFCRGSQHRDRIPLGGGPLRTIAGAGRRSGPPASRGNRRDTRPR